MSIETERLVSDTPPTAEQLHRLASIGVASAVAREKLKRVNRAYTLADEICTTPDDSVFDTAPSTVLQRMAMRIAAKPATPESEKVWSFLYDTAYSVKPNGGQWLEERSLYLFRWTRSRTLVADRALTLFGFETPKIETVSDAIDTFRIDDDSVAILHASNQLQIVTDEDCEELIQDASEYFSTLNTANNA